MTKPFVAARVVRLAASGVLGLDDPLSRWMPRFLLLSLVIERATHRRLAGQLPPAFVVQPQERPAGEVAVGYLDGHPTSNDPFVPSRAVVTSAWGSGSLLASAGDLARLGDALLREAPSRGMTRWVTASGDPPEYGLGLMHIRLAGRDAWGHSGDIDGFHSDLWYLPSAHVTVAALVNRNLQDSRRRLVEALARVAAGHD